MSTMFSIFNENNRPTSQQSGKINENGFGNQHNGTADGGHNYNRPTSTLSQGGGLDGIDAAWGVKTFSTSRGRGGRGGGIGSSGRGAGTTGSNANGTEDRQENDSSMQQEEPKQQSENQQQEPAENGQKRTANFSRRRGEGVSGAAGRHAAEDGTDFGDAPEKIAGTGANTAPLSSRGGFGNKGLTPITYTNGTGGDETNANSAAENGDQNDNNNRRQAGFAGRVGMGGRGGGSTASFGRRGGGGNTRFGKGGEENGSRQDGTFGSRRGGGYRGPLRGGDREGDCNRDGRNRIGFDGRASDFEFGNNFSKPLESMTPDERAKRESHVPKDRAIDEIVAEDLHVAENYRTIAEEDDECVVTGLPENAATQILDNWADAGFEEQILKNIERSAYLRPRKIQSLTIPLIMDGHDIKGHAETGSGKSAAFLLPIINIIMQKKKKGEYESKRICPYCLIIEPTRELVCQLYDQARKLSENCGVSVSKAYGKFHTKENAREISKQGCDILIGTPGRLIHFFMENYLECEKLKMFVLDEADQLLEDDFARHLRRLQKVEGFPLVDNRHTLLFSATFAPEVQLWANEWLKRDNVMVSNRKSVTANSRVVQKFVKIVRDKKKDKLLEMLQAEQQEATQENLVKRILVFVKMKRTADLMSNYLNINKLKSTTINGDRPQKLREESLNHFRTGRYNIVVATDVCARGIDIKNLDHVINMDLPLDHTTYVHRIGRTGRLKEGVATSFFDPNEDMHLSRDLVEGLKGLGQDVPDWLQDAADGKMPEMEDPYAQTNRWGGSCFADKQDEKPAMNGENVIEDNDEW